MKILSWEELLLLRAKAKLTASAFGWTNGCFDLVHIGHIHFLRIASQLCKVLVIGMNSDQSVRQLKGPDRPLFDQTVRTDWLSELRSVEFLHIFDDLTPERIISELKPDIHFKSTEYLPDGKPMPEREIIEAYGGKIEYISLEKGWSTTSLLERISRL